MGVVYRWVPLCSCRSILTCGRGTEIFTLDKPSRSIFLTIAIIGAITWLAIFEHNYHPRIYKYTYEPSSGVQAPPSKPGRLRPELSPKEVITMSWLTHARALT